MSDFKMAMSSLDPRTGGSCLNLLAKKFCSYVVCYVQLIIWIVAFFILVFNPSSVTNVVQNADTTSMVITGFMVLFCIIFSVVLLLGLWKDRRLYVKTYCIYIVVYLVLVAVGFVVNLFVQPQRLGFRGFFSMVVSFLLNLFFFIVVRCYYLIKYCSGSNQMVANQPKV